MMRKLLITATLAVLLAGCASEPKAPPAPVEDRAAPTAPVPPPPPSTAPTTQAPIAGNPLRDPNNILSKRSVYFDYDSFVVKEEFRPLVTAHARYLSANHGAHITIQGNADERGSSEYNLALGQKRADAVKRTLSLLGVPDAQVETISFGKEKPKNPGHDEAAWAENRRADIVYAGE
jgi:peptidoglycan-associated lipoprotein